MLSGQREVVAKLVCQKVPASRASFEVVAVVRKMMMMLRRMLLKEIAVDAVRVH